MYCVLLFHSINSILLNTVELLLSVAFKTLSLRYILFKCLIKTRMLITFYSFSLSFSFFKFKSSALKCHWVLLLQATTMAYVI